jgi:predicted ArsR family transcriptional regulator
MVPRDSDSDLDAIASLGEPSRRALYRFVAGSPEEVSRDQAARATGLSRMLAAFHLDRLVSAGLLEATFRRISGRSGPGAGRPAKLYRRARQPVSVSLPQRRYDIVSKLLAEVIERSGDGSVRNRLGEAARELGRRLASNPNPLPRRNKPREALAALLTELGFEPYEDGGVVRLRNCPFDALAQAHRELICSTNLCLMEGVLEGLAERRMKVQLERLSEGCCVAFDGLRSDPLI